MVTLVLDENLWIIPPFIYMSVMLIVFVLEKIHPWEKDWNQSKGDIFLDIQHLVGNLTVSSIALAFYNLSFEFRSLVTFPGLLNSNIYLQYIIGLMAFDFGLYYIHRISHTVKWLWRLHAIHHSSERVYFLNGQKRHLLHEILEGSPGFIILWVVGIRPEVALVIIYTVNIHLLFQHANVNYRLGVFNKIFSASEGHRWHHQRDWKDVQGNYGAIFSVWDLIFGTFLHRNSIPGKNVGLDEPANLARMSYFRQHLWPFKST